MYLNSEQSPDPPRLVFTAMYLYDDITEGHIISIFVFKISPDIAIGQYVSRRYVASLAVVSSCFWIL